MVRRSDGQGLIFVEPRAGPEHLGEHEQDQRADYRRRVDMRGRGEPEMIGGEMCGRKGVRTVDDAGAIDLPERERQGEPADATDVVRCERLPDPRSGGYGAA